MCESLEVQCMLNRHFNPLTKNNTSLENHWIPSDVALFNQSSPDWIILRGIKQLSVDISSVLYYCFLKEQQYSFYGGQQRPSSLKKGPSPWEKQWFTHTAGIPLGTLSWGTSTTLCWTIVLHTHTKMNLNFGYNKQPDHYHYGGSTTPVEEYATTRTKPPHSCVFNRLCTLMMTVEGTHLLLLTLSRWKPEGISQITCKTCLTLIQVTASLVCPLHISGPLVTLRHLPFATGGHVIALWHGHVQSG